MGLLDLLGLGKKRKKAMIEALKNGAVIVDVRSPAEFQGGHVAGAHNYPLDRIGSQLEGLKAAGKPVVFCCASGMRSGRATSQAKSAGITAYNGGGWMSLNGIVQELKESH
ncbi:MULTISPECIES: rhodanese-like domain-containing protein [Reichenbachiella]|uniref:rhodanese-like domain-containing protein n=1 Tax=Reichenbachiella TaxID=156993 RepID=UPI000E6CF286|nr:MULTISPECIES: rhodanese-like domain-containing protein [Reichenbachiella]MBU2914541.1 rhodanese-like domain-containing protein [Reichenbachiella agariperforans]RJE73958.1 sulfurtransferase [Reichenbachiella sp. MSK19-1]